MSKTLKYVLIAAGVGAVVYIAGKKLLPAPAPDKPNSVGGALDSIVTGVNGIVDAVKSKPLPSNGASAGAALPDNSPFAPSVGLPETGTMPTAPKASGYLPASNYWMPTTGATTRRQQVTAAGAESRTGIVFDYAGLDA